MTKQSLPLSELTRAELELLRRAITRRQLPMPLTELGLRSIGKERLFARLGVLVDASEGVALALIDLALALGDVPAATESRAPAMLVWTAPAVHLQKARSTQAVLLELLGSAKDRVLIAGYEFDHGAALFGPLHDAMRERGVKVDIYFEIAPAPSPKSVIEAYLAVQVERFLDENWPFGPPLPRLFGFRAGYKHGSRSSLHAKCVVVDNRHVLIGSANFTKRGHTRNLEVGVRIDDAELAGALIYQFERLVERDELAAVAMSPIATPVPRAAEDEDDGADSAPTTAGRFEELANELGVSTEAKALCVRILASDLPTPDVGNDVEGSGGEAIGSPELSWAKHRVAVLLPEQEGDRRKLEASRWTCFTVERAMNEYDALCALLRREG